MDAFRLDGRVAFITGAGSATGIGRAIALSYAAAGAAAAVVDLDRAGAEATAEALRATGARAVGLPVDVANPASVAEAVAQAEQALGPIDILVNAAGITGNVPVWETTLELFDRFLDVNVRGGFNCLRAVMPGMMERRRGRIIWISSVAGKQGGGVFGSTAYATSKAAVIGLCQGVARELGPYGITSNAIAPGLTLTGMVARASSQELQAEIARRIAEAAPLRRVASAQDIANAALFLASDAASYITGEILDVNGGTYFD